LTAPEMAISIEKLRDIYFILIKGLSRAQVDTFTYCTYYGFYGYGVGGDKLMRGFACPDASLSPTGRLTLNMWRGAPPWESMNT